MYNKFATGERCQIVWGQTQSQSEHGHRDWRSDVDATAVLPSLALVVWLGRIRWRSRRNRLRSGRGFSQSLGLFRGWLSVAIVLQTWFNTITEKFGVSGRGGKRTKMYTRLWSNLKSLKITLVRKCGVGVATTLESEIGTFWSFWTAGVEFGVRVAINNSLYLFLF